MNMLEDKTLLELCLGVSGRFEDGTAKIDWDVVAGNFDGMGMSVGVLQWNAGTGTLQTLLQNIGARMGWDKAQTFFKSDIHHLAVLPAADAVQFCLDHYIAEGSTKMDPGAAAAWKAFLGTPESIVAQTELATNGVLGRAKVLVHKFCPAYANRLRAYAFFFDLVTQSGGMQNKKGSVEPTTTPDWQAAITFAYQKSAKTAEVWNGIVGNDPLAQLLLHYAYQRALLSNELYVWDACSRRGTIACRDGYVHGARVDLTATLD